MAEDKEEKSEIEETDVNAIFDQINDALNLLKKGDQSKDKNKKRLDSNIEAQLSDLEDEVEVFSFLTDLALKKAGATEEETKKKLSEPAKYLDRQEQRLLKRAEKLNELLEGIDEKITERLEQAQEEGGEVTQSKKSKKKKVVSGKERKKKFKRLGGGKWTPL